MRPARCRRERERRAASSPSMPIAHAVASPRTTAAPRRCSAACHWWELLLIPLGFAVGAYGTLVGAGGGFVLVPVLLHHLPGRGSGEHHVDLARRRLLQRAVRFGGVRAPQAHRLLAGPDLRRRRAAGRYRRRLPRQRRAARYLRRDLRRRAARARRLHALGVGPHRRRCARRCAAACIIRRDDAGRRTKGRRSATRTTCVQGIALQRGIGFLSSLLGIGGGVIHVPVDDHAAALSRARRRRHIAVRAAVHVGRSGSAVHLANGESRGRQRRARAAAVDRRYPRRAGRRAARAAVPRAGRSRGCWHRR